MTAYVSTQDRRFTRDAEDRTRFIGYKVEHVKLAIFTFSAMLAGLAGALYVPQVGIINPGEFQPLNSIEVVIWVAVGGRAALYGAVLGALGAWAVIVLCWAAVAVSGQWWVAVPAASSWASRASNLRTPKVSLPTMDPRPVPRAASTAATEPPPGAEERAATSSMKPRTVRPARGSSGSSATMYSMIFSWGLKGATALSPKRSTARRTF